MRSVLVTAAAGLMLSLTAVPSQALPITDIYTPPGGSLELSFGNPISYQHNLLDDGFDPLNDILGSVTLTLSLTGAGGQNLSVQLDGDPTFSGQFQNLGQPIAVTLSFLQTDGLLNVVLTKLQSNSSNFTFTGSTLFAAGVPTTQDTNPTSAPEPASLLLFGAGATLLARHMRRPARS